MTLAVPGELLVAYLLASVRIVAWLAIVPPFAGRSVPVMAKVVLSLGLSFAVAPKLAEGGIAMGNAELLVNVVTQVLIGTAMGFVTYLLFAAIAAAGSLVDVFGGFSLAQGFDPLSMNMNTVFGKFHQLLATVLLFATGGHLLVIGGLLKTFDVLPLGEMPDVSGLPDVLHQGVRGVLRDRRPDRAAADRRALRRRPRPGPADQGRPAAPGHELHVPGQDRADPAAARPVVPGPPRGGTTGSSDLATEAMAQLAGAG